jgi:hypothetical protein
MLGKIIGTDANTAAANNQNVKLMLTSTDNANGHAYAFWIGVWTKTQ